MVTSAVSLPGFQSPAVGFEQPFEMLEACHERVQRSLALLARLVAYIDAKGHDASSRSAAGDVLRYFDIAGPHHHEDEERHLFPLLKEHADARVRGAVAQLQADHVEMHALWQRLRAVLLAWRDGEPAPAVTDAARTLARDFAAAYERHIPLEESLAYPAARTLLAAADLQRIGAEMAARRRA
ncbi:hemerythrin domain-containing protein [Ottowia testudinis]|uniref:Hemerythrin domain-containing protein n=1 Tax=Ottowia testudinis TaxID=2816950 RepID=A0A975H2X2_9BURK|nr:hemerythrin domain-containing protein [Ottowia testudinis]QTD44655.1 hemerythrin domain-containing protein [Ottowia testudinis]